MTSLPITCSNLQSPARGTSVAQVNGLPDVQAAESFGTLLAQQMEETGITALIAPSPTIVIDTEATADSINLTDIEKVEQDKTSAATDISSDYASYASALAAMLQLPRETKRGAETPTVKDTTDGTTAAVHPMTTSRTEDHPPTTNTDTIRVQAESGMTIAAHQVTRNTFGLEIAGSTALTNNLPRVPPPTQDVAPSIAASAIMPNMLANNGLLDTRQTITTPLGNSGWADEFSQKINWVSTQQNQVAELHLSPPDLGPLNVVLKISDNQATALFTSPHSAVRDAVENALPKLRETLADNGITLGDTTVSDQPPRDRDAERFMSQGTSAAAQREGSGEAFGPESLLTVDTQIASARRHNGMVDIFA